MTHPAESGFARAKPPERQRLISELVMNEGSIRIEELARLFSISSMTVHRDLDELEARGLLRKSRGLATALPSSLVESSDMFRASQELAAKADIAQYALRHLEPGQAVFLDDSTTVQQLVPLLDRVRPLTVITNCLTVIDRLAQSTGTSLVTLGGSYYAWCNSFMGRMTVTNIRSLRADLFLHSTAAVTDGICFHQNQETVDIKRAMFESSAKRILLVDYTKFSKRALYAVTRLQDIDEVIVDQRIPAAEVASLRANGVTVAVAEQARKQEGSRGSAKAPDDEPEGGRRPSTNDEFDW